jgi:hypothetical protein
MNCFIFFRLEKGTKNAASAFVPWTLARANNMFLKGKDNAKKGRFSDTYSGGGRGI